MPTLDDLPTLAAIAPTSDDLLPIYDLTGNGSSKVRKVSVNALKAIPSDGVQATAAGTITVTGPVLLINSGSTSTITLPSASGTLRNVTIINGGSGTATISTSVISGTAVSGATNTTLATTVTGSYVSNGTSWYRVS